MAPDQRFTHVAVTVSRACLEAPLYGELLSFYGDVFGWSENVGLSIAGERIFMRAPTDAQYITLRASDAPMRTSGYEHLGVEVPTPARLRELHARAAARSDWDPRVEVGEVSVKYGGHLHTFRVRYLLPLTIEVQCLVETRPEMDRLARRDRWSVRGLQPTDIPACERLLARLPAWFGLEAQNRAYVESLETLPAAVAELEGECAGFVALEQHYPESVEIHVMAVEPRLHRRGIGRALTAWAEDWCRARGVRWLHVKTRGPATPDPGYEWTRRFYGALGFAPLFESRTLWGPEDAALILVKTLDVPG